MAEWADVTYVPDPDGDDVLVSAEDKAIDIEVEDGDDSDIPVVYIEAHEEEDSGYHRQDDVYKDVGEAQSTDVTSPQSESEAFPGQAKRRKKGKVHICEECGMSFAATSSYKRHLLIHSDLRPFECADCGRRFRSRTNLLQHILIHTKIKPHQCNDCGKSFSRSTHLKIHSCQRRCPAQNAAFLAEKKSRDKEEEEGEELMVVPEVDISVQEEEVETVTDPTTPSNSTPAPPLMIMKHDADDEAATCDICGAYFVKKSGLRRHKALSHRDGDSSSKNSFCCSVCKAKFAFLGLLEKHMRSHQLSMGFRCDQCGETFEKRTDVECHIATHNLANKNDLSISQSQHTVGVELAPASSSAALMKPSPLTRVVSTVRAQQPTVTAQTLSRAKSLYLFPYECKSCRERFATELLLSAHQVSQCPLTPSKQQQLPRNRPCPKCKKQFSSETALAIHRCVPANPFGSQQMARNLTGQLPLSSSGGNGLHAIRSARGSSAGTNFITSPSRTSIAAAPAAVIRRGGMEPVNSSRSDTQNVLPGARRLITATRTVMPEPPPLTSQTAKEPRTRAVGQVSLRDQAVSRQSGPNKSVELTPVTVIDSKGKSMKAFILPNSHSGSAAGPKATKSEPPQLLAVSSRSGGALSNAVNSSTLSMANKHSAGSALGGTSVTFGAVRGVSPAAAASAANSSLVRMPRSMQNSRYRCGECRFNTMDYKEYENHVSLHRRDQQFACQYCPYSTRQQVSLERHQRTHNLGSASELVSSSILRNQGRKPVVETIEIPEGLFD